MSVRGALVKVITRGERRVWTSEQKRDIVVESLEPGGSPIAVARRHGIGSGLLYTWRRQLVEGHLEAPVPAPPSFVPVAALPKARAQRPISRCHRRHPRPRCRVLCPPRSRSCCRMV